MRAIWKGAIAFGLVNVPVKVYSATEDHDISLHQVHNADGGRIRYQRRCEVCSKIIDYSDIDKAFEDDGRTVVLSKDELKSIPAENSHEIEVVQFVPSEQLEPMMFEKSYYLEPDSKSPKAYVLLRRALEDTDRVAIVQFALREKTRLGALRIKDEVLVLQSLLWPDEVRDASFPALDTSIRISAQEREMSAALVESMAADFEPEHFTDDYQAQLRKLIEAKLEKGDSLDTDETFGAEAGGGGNGEVIDLMEALKRSLERKRGGGKPAASEDADAEDADDAGTGESADSSGGKAPAKAGAKTAGTRTTRTQTAAAKSSGTKTAATSAASKSTATKSTAAKPAAKAATTRARKGA
ncbi:non-homologous end joining protein Ku [Pseudarthrobacter cellobiosi]|uniref:non-homologous end joining protein Ku n=1 Tax=Pseudarthrobacter cellobiosi TaxID=2953654 RepID=UPI00208E27FD|nr:MULTISPECIES: Ku protein [unclassified Pseudarthrobacter]MCO4256160.1 Ku protein [Pseudarthrobacter sp. HLT1-5]MCO4275391.1 Ku protein [Pseudarthrobacter sp. HLT3-5]